MSGAIFGIAGLFPSEYMSAVVSGQALGGILTALAFIMVLAAGTTPSITAFIFFSIGSVLILFCIISYAMMTSRPLFKHYIEGTESKRQIISNTPSSSRGNALDVGVSLEPNLSEVLAKIYVHAVTILLLFATTLSVYPAVTVLMQSQYYGQGLAWNGMKKFRFYFVQFFL